MTAPHDDAATDLHSIIAELRAERDAARAKNEELAQRLTHWDVAYEERIAHQLAVNAVLKAMAASPGDPQPVFEMIVRLAKEVCQSVASGLFTFDGTLVHYRAATGLDPVALSRRCSTTTTP